MTTKDTIRKDFFLILAIAIVASTAVYAPVFPFRPVFYIQKRNQDQKLCYMNMPPNDGLISKIEDILSCYNERHIRIKNTIYIPFRLLVDKDSLRNYTSKAGVPCPDSRFSRYHDADYDLWVEKSGWLGLTNVPPDLIHFERKQSTKE